MTFQTSGINKAYDHVFVILNNEEDNGVGEESWTFRAIKKLLFAIDHFCELVSNFASELNLMNLGKTMGLKESQDFVRSLNVTLKDDPSDPDLRDKVMPFIRQNTLDCKSILVACMWEGNQSDCKNMFVPVVTDVGMGCSFNRIPEELLRNSSGLISLLYNQPVAAEELNEWRNYQLDKELLGAIERLKTPRKFPRSQNQAGTMSGLSFLLRHRDFNTLSCPVMSANAYLVSIHSPFEEPQMMKSSVTIPPAHEVVIKVKGELTVAKKALEYIGIHKRDCVFQSESKLKLYSRYTLANCRKECLHRRIVSVCKCHQLSFSTGQNETICGPLDISCVQNESRVLAQDGYNSLCKDLNCLTPCNNIKYETAVSYLPYANENIFDFSRASRYQLRYTGKPSCRNSSTSIVHVTFESNGVTTRERKLVIAFAFLVGVIGGILGFALEFSFASFFNILAGLGVLFPIRYFKKCLGQSKVYVCSAATHVNFKSGQPPKPADVALWIEVQPAPSTSGNQETLNNTDNTATHEVEMNLNAVHQKYTQTTHNVLDSQV